MSTDRNLADVFENLRQSLETNRLAHAYLIVGSPQGAALALVESFLQLMLCRESKRPCGVCTICRHVQEHVHPDIMWMEPESKSRKILIGDETHVGIRDLNQFISLTPMVGDRKAGVILHADRLTDQAANAFLKTLEEPPASSLLFLLTQAPQHLLPTIVSRCQKIILSEDVESEAGPWLSKLLELLREDAPASTLGSMMQSARLRSILDEVKKSIEKKEAGDAAADDVEEETNESNESEDDAFGGEDAKEGFVNKEARKARIAARQIEVRSAIMKNILLWRRDVLLAVLGIHQHRHFEKESAAINRQASKLAVADAMGKIREVETMIRRLDRNLPPPAVFDIGLK